MKPFVDTKKPDNKRVIDGVYETGKMRLTIAESMVSKQFKSKESTHRRYMIEKSALIQLKGIKGFPQLLESFDDMHLLRMTRLSGVRPNRLSESHLHQLHHLVRAMLKAGVARHSLPIRDLLVSPQGKISMVDFERATLKSRSSWLTWWVAKQVSLYHLYRLMAQYQPQMLTPGQSRFVQYSLMLRGLVHKVNHL